jgi:hypothetical protein
MHLLHFVVKRLERRVPKPRRRIIHRRCLLRQRLDAIQYLNQRRYSLIIAQPLTGKRPGETARCKSPKRFVPAIARTHP